MPAAVSRNSALRESKRKRIQETVEVSLMLVTELNQFVGYDKAAKLAKTAHQRAISLRDENRELGFLTEEKFDGYLRPEKMVARNKEVRRPLFQCGARLFVGPLRYGLPNCPR
jgi:fumarate hydratase class II